MQNFRDRMKDYQIRYKEEVLGIKEMGRWRNNPHILPQNSWALNLWERISREAIEYFTQSKIAWHAQKHNLLSSQIMCINIFFPLKQHLDILEAWLRSCHFNVEKVVDLDFEYTGPKNYFNEQGVSR